MPLTNIKNAYLDGDTLGTCELCPFTVRNRSEFMVALTMLNHLQTVHPQAVGVTR